MCAMIPINNSDTAWLITADYNQDKDIGFPEELREDVLNPEVNQWYGSDVPSYHSDCVGSCLTGFGTALGPSIKTIGGGTEVGSFDTDVGVGGNGIITAGVAYDLRHRLVEG